MLENTVLDNNGIRIALGKVCSYLCVRLYTCIMIIIIKFHNLIININVLTSHLISYKSCDYLSGSHEDGGIYSPRLILEVYYTMEAAKIAILFMIVL